MASWSPQDFTFQPYQLQAQRRINAESEPIEKRRGGRQRRSSIACQVEGCNAELINEKTYYKRYRICTTHCNMKSMVVQGRRQRFCQQCGRFHDITEFEGTRKSCKRKLERHNQRRRNLAPKGCTWQTDSEDEDDASVDADYSDVSVKRSSRFRLAKGSSKDLSGSQGTTKQDDPATAQSPCPPDAKLSGYMEVDEFASFLSAPEMAARAAAQPSTAANPGQIVPATCSDTPTETHQNMQDGSGRSSPMVPKVVDVLQRTPFANFKDLPIHANQDIGDVPDGLILFPENPTDAMLTADIDLNVDVMAFLNATSNIDDLPNVNLNSHAHQNILGMAGDFFLPPAPPDALPVLPNMRTAFSAPAPAVAPAAAPLTALQAASSMISLGGTPRIGYEVTDVMVRLSIKLFNCTPDVLAPAVKAELLTLIKAASDSFVEGYVRPGCVHVTVAARVPVEEAEAHEGEAFVSAVQGVLDRGVLGPAVTDSMLVQLKNELVVVKQKRIMAAIDTSKSSCIMPKIIAVRPLAVQSGQHRTQIMLAGSQLHDPEALIMCRQGGRNLTVEIPEADVQNMALIAVLGLAPGVADFEVQAGSFLGPHRAMVVLPHKTVVDEVRQLEEGGSVAVGIATDAFLRDLGLVAQFLDRHNAVAEGRPVPTYTPTLLRTIENIACKVAAAAVARGWAAVLAYVLPATTAGGLSIAQAAAVMDAACPQGSTLLHVAVGTGRLSVVTQLVHWARSTENQPSPWAADSRGPAGITPLHVAAMLPINICATMRHELDALTPAADKLWRLVQSDDGVTPENLADVLLSEGSSQESGEGSIRLASVPTGEDEIKASPSVSANNKANVETDLITTRLLSLKNRNEVKAQLVGDHIGAMMVEMDNMKEKAPYRFKSGLVYGAVVAGSAMAMALGAVALGLNCSGLST